MPEGLVPRMAIEWGFLILLAVGAGIADLRPLLIILVMLIGWILLVLVELLAWRARPTFAVTEAVPEPTGVDPAAAMAPAAAAQEVAFEPAPEPAPVSPLAPSEAPIAPPDRESAAPAYDFEFERPAQEAETDILASPKGTSPAAAPVFSASPGQDEGRVELDPDDPYAPAPERQRLLEGDQRAVYRLEPLKPRPKRRLFGRSSGTENKRS